MLSTTIQLAVRGKPSAFDLSCNNEMCVVASPGCLTFFLLSGLGSPRHVIHYEQPQQIRQIRYQKYGNLAALRGGVVSLWDPSKSLRPLLGFVQTSGWITDLDWNTSNHNILATSSDSAGGVSLWDMRAPSYSTMQIFAGHVATSVDWCPSNVNLLAACSDSQNVFVWDIRMVNSGASSGSSAGPKCDSLAVISSLPGSILTSCWSGREVLSHKSPPSSYPSIILGKTSGALEWWDINANYDNSLTNSTNANPGQRSNQTADASRAAAISPVHLDASSIMLSVPMGRGVIVCQRQDSAANKLDNPLMKMTGKEGGAGSGSQMKSLFAAEILSGSSSSRNYLSPSSSPSDNRIDISLYRYPRAGLALKNAFSPPTEKPLSNTEGRTTLLASCCETILGVRWGAPGRLVPPAHTGLELVMLTDSAALHVLKVLADTLESGPEERNLHSSVSTNAQSSSGGGGGERRGPAMQPKYALKKPSIAASSYNDSHALSARAVASKSTIPFRTPGYEVELVPSASLTLNSITGQSLVYESDPSKIEFWALLQREILGLEESLQRGNLAGLSISRVDQYARQVTLEVSQTSASGPLSPHTQSSGTLRSALPMAAYPPDLSATLIVSFPSKFPSQGVPSYTIRGSGMSLGASALSAELTAVMVARNSQKHSTQYNPNPNPSPSRIHDPGFLIEIAGCFLARVVQIKSHREYTGVHSAMLQTLDPLILPPDETVDDRSAERNAGSSSIPSSSALKLDGGWEEGDSDKESDLGTADADVIDPLAYRIPCPRSSGASFSALGVLVCFGGASLSLCPGSERGRKKPPSPALSMPYPKTLADLLVAERTRAEQMAVKAAEEAEANALAAVELEIIAQNQRTQSGRGRGRGRGGRRGRETHTYGTHGSGSDNGDGDEDAFEDAQSSGDSSDSEDGSNAFGGEEGLLAFEEGLMSSGKHLEGAEIAPKSFLYSTTQMGITVGTGQERGKRAPPTPKGLPSSLSLPPSALGSDRGTAQGSGSGSRGRHLSIEGPPSTLVSPSHKAPNVAVGTSTGIGSGPVWDGVAPSSSTSTAVSASRLSRSGSDNQLPHKQAATSLTPPNYLGGGGSLLPLSMGHPLDSLELLGASLDQHQEEINGTTAHSEDKYGYEGEEEVDVEEGERGSIAMSNKPFRIKLYQAADVRAQLLAFHYTLGPLSSCDSDAASVWSARATACRHNAAVMGAVEGILQLRATSRRTVFEGKHMSPSPTLSLPPPSASNPCSDEADRRHSSGRVGCHGNVRVVQQLWNLLASSIEVMAPKKRNSPSGRKCPPNAELSDWCAPTPSSPVSVCVSDSMPMGDGSGVDWSTSTLGRSLLCRCVLLLTQSGDLQTLATVVCIFGGSTQLVSLMAPGASRGGSEISCPLSVQGVEQLLGAYSETLRRWSAILQATEVSKHMQADCLKPHTRQRKSGGRLDDPVSDLDGEGDITDYVTLVGLGVNCPKCGTATECGDRDEEGEGEEEGDNYLSAELEESETERGRERQHPLGSDTTQHVGVVCVEREMHKKRNPLWCIPCRDYALVCSLCQRAIRGAGYFCASCGHGGHTGHMREWFEHTVECAAGCGCRCGELAIVGHGTVAKKYSSEGPGGEGEGTDQWGGSGSHSSSKPGPLSGSVRHAADRDREVPYDRQGSSDYFFCNPGSSSEGSASERSDVDSEFNSSMEDEEQEGGDGSELEGEVRTGLGSAGVMKGRGVEGSRRDPDADSYLSFSQDWDNGS